MNSTVTRGTLDAVLFLQASPDGVRNMANPLKHLAGASPSRH